MNYNSHKCPAEHLRVRGIYSLLSQKQLVACSYDLIIVNNQKYIGISGIKMDLLKTDAETAIIEPLNKH